MPCLVLVCVMPCSCAGVCDAVLVLVCWFDAVLVQWCDAVLVCWCDAGLVH